MGLVLYGLQRARFLGPVGGTLAVIYNHKLASVWLLWKPNIYKCIAKVNLISVMKIFNIFFTRYS